MHPEIPTRTTPIAAAVAQRMASERGTIDATTPARRYPDGKAEERDIQADYRDQVIPSRIKRFLQEKAYHIFIVA
jgi:hypothetical protein